MLCSAAATANAAATIRMIDMVASPWMSHGCLGDGCTVQRCPKEAPFRVSPRPNAGASGSGGQARRGRFHRRFGGDRNGTGEEGRADDGAGEAFQHDRLRVPDKGIAARHDHQAAMIAVVALAVPGHGRLVRRVTVGRDGGSVLHLRGRMPGRGGVVRHGWVLRRAGVLRRGGVMRRAGPHVAMQRDHLRPRKGQKNQGELRTGASRKVGRRHARRQADYRRRGRCLNLAVWQDPADLGGSSPGILLFSRLSGRGCWGAARETRPRVRRNLRRRSPVRSRYRLQP